MEHLVQSLADVPVEPPQDNPEKFLCLPPLKKNYYLFIFCLVAQRLKRLPPMLETRVRSLGREDPLEKEMVTHSSILAWRIPWTEESGGLHAVESQRIRHD